MKIAYDAEATDEVVRTAWRALIGKGRPMGLGLRLHAITAAAFGCFFMLLFAPAAGAYVYWTNPDATNSIGRANLDGSAVNQTFIPGSGAEQCGVTVDVQHVYWSDFGVFNPTLMPATTIGRANLDGSGVNESFITGLKAPCGIAVDAQHVYWANEGMKSGTTIGRANLNGTSVEREFIKGAADPCGVAVDATHIYWTNIATGTVGRANLNGTNVDQTFINGLNGPCGIAVDAQHIYWANLNPYGGSQGTTIGRANLDGSEATESFITGINAPSDVAVDGSHIYWSGMGDHAIGRANLNGSGAEYHFIATGSDTLGVAVDGLPAPPPNALPSNAFTLGKARRNGRFGSVKQPVTVPGPGALTLTGKGVYAVRPGGVIAVPRVRAAGTFNLLVKPKRKTKRKLDRTGRARVKISVTYTPTGGSPSSKSKRLVLKERVH